MYLQGLVVVLVLLAVLAFLAVVAVRSLGRFVRSFWPH